MAEIEHSSEAERVGASGDSPFDLWAREVGRELRRAAPAGGLRAVQLRRETKRRRRMTVASAATALIFLGVAGAVTARRAGDGRGRNISTDASSTVPAVAETTQAGPAAPTTLAPTTLAPTTLAPTTEPLSQGGVEGVDFGTFTYDLAYGLGSISVVDGTAIRGRLGDAECLDARVERVLTGDMDGDGRAEAAVTLSYGCSGGTGRITDVYVYRWDGRRPELIGRAGAGDRARGGVRWTALVNGGLQIDRYDGVAACCPTSVVRRTLEVQSDRLVERDAPITYSLASLGSNVDASGEETIRFLPATDTAFFGSTAEPAPPAGFDARQGQRLTLKIDELDRDSVYAPLDVVRDGAVLGGAKPGAPLTITLPADGHYQIRVAPGSVPAGGTPPRVEAELTIAG